MTCYNNMFEAYTDIINKLKNKDVVEVRGLKTQEIINCSFIVKNHSLDWPENDVNKPKETYIKAEKEWYNEATLKVNSIEKYGTIWRQIKSNYNNVNSNYGYYVWNRYSCGMNQFEFVIDELKKDLYSRKAIININALEHKYPNNPDMPCTIAIQYLVRDNKLNTIVYMRSNDIQYGFRNDMPWFVHLSSLITKELNIELGDYYHNAGSMHLYLK